MSEITYKFNFSDYSEYDNSKNEWAYERCPQKNYKDTDISNQERVFDILIAVQRKIDDDSRILDLIVNNDSLGSYEQTTKPFEVMNKQDKKSVRTTGLIGVVRVEGVEFAEENNTCDVEITIVSRFDTQKDKPFFLTHMLSFENPKLINFMPKSRDENLFEILLLYLFKHDLQEAYRQGIFKSYQRFERNDNRLKGPIDIARHIRDNIPFNINIAYNSREHSYNNNINFLILHAYDQLKRCFPEVVQSFLLSDSTFNGIVSSIRESAPGFFTSDVTKVMSKCLRPIAHPYFQKYEALRQTCIRILRHTGLSVFYGDRGKIKGILFYIPKLWESFLLHKFRCYKSNNKYYVSEQKRINIFRISGNENYIKEIKPDFVFIEQDYGNIDKPFFILDAKFKPKWYDASTKSDISQVFDDYLQVINYMFSYNTKAAGVIFPTNAGVVESKRFDISQYNESNKFYCYGILVPNSNKYDEYEVWCSDFTVNVKRCIDSIQNDLDKFLLSEQMK